MNIHATAIVESGAELASDVEVGPYAMIGPKAKIGAGCKVAAHAMVKGNTTIGENNYIGHFAVIGGPPQDLKYAGEDTKLIIGDNNTIREFVTMNTGTHQAGGETKMGSNCLLMAYTHVGHDCIIGNNCIVANSTNLAGHVILEDWVTITGGVGVSQFNRIGMHAYIGGHSAIDKNVAPFCIGYGNRIRIRGINVIGLKRRGYDADRIRAISDAHKIFFDANKEKAQAIQEIEELYPDQADVQYFLAFVKNAKNGIAQ